MKLQRKIENWCRDEKFLRYADGRMAEEVLDMPENHRHDPKYDELEEAFERDGRYAVPLVEYLLYRLHLAKLCKNAKQRRRGIWWVFVQVSMQGYVVPAFADVFDPLLTELQETVLPMLHRQYVRKSNHKKR